MRVFEPGRIFCVGQMYDENGNAFYPVTHKDCIIGGVNDLDVGITLSTVDLNACITGPHIGSFIMKEFNNLTYVLSIDITRFDNTPFPLDKDIILARDIPELYSTPFFTAIGNGFDDILLWIDNHYLKARIVRKSKVDYTNCPATIDRILSTGILIR